MGRRRRAREGWARVEGRIWEAIFLVHKNVHQSKARHTKCDTGPRTSSGDECVEWMLKPCNRAAG
jgi:hypothetical protein